VYKWRHADLSVLGLSRFIGMLVPFLTIPILVQTVGLKNWAWIALFQTIGVIFGLIIDLSWATFGAARISNLKFIEQRNTFAAVQGRRFILFILIEILILLCLQLVNTPLDILLSFSSVSFGIASSFSNQWFWIGTGTPLNLFYQEAAPRLLLTLLFVLIIDSKTGVICYFISFILLVFLIGFFFPSPLSVKATHKLDIKLQQDLSFAFTRVLQSSYFLFSLPLLGFLRPEIVSSFAQLERCYRFAMSVTLPINQALQLEMTKRQFSIRSLMRRSFMYSGVSTLVFLFSSSEPFSRYIFKSEFEFSFKYKMFIMLIFIVTFNRSFATKATFSNITTNEFSKYQFYSATLFMLLVFPLTKEFAIWGLVSLMGFCELLTFILVFRRLRTIE